MEVKKKISINLLQILSFFVVVTLGCDGIASPEGVLQSLYNNNVMEFFPSEKTSGHSVQILLKSCESSECIKSAKVFCEAYLNNSAQEIPSLFWIFPVESTQKVTALKNQMKESSKIKELLFIDPGARLSKSLALANSKNTVLILVSGKEAFRSETLDINKVKNKIKELKKDFN